MRSPMRILHLEDNPKDAEFVQAMLAAEGLPFKINRVEARDAFVAALEEGGFDMIISDYTLPSYDGHSALLAAQAKRPEVPFIFFSGTLGEEHAIRALKDGATDYVLKSKPARFVSAVVRALREAEEKAERKRLEEQLRQAQKMEAIGQLAGGIAHDFNNLLTVINGYSELTLLKLPPDHPLGTHLKQIRTAGKRAASLTNQILAFSRKQVLAAKVLDLNEVLKAMEKLLRRLIGDDIAIVTKLKPGIGRIKCDSGQIEQILMNLTVNARDAMPSGGTLIIETADVKLGEKTTASGWELEPGFYVVLTVSDSGCGMDEATQTRIFEPFFTTKEPGKGTGLGLSTVYGIIKQHQGAITVYSEVGKGSTFKVYLPRVDDLAGSRETVAHEAAVPTGTETVLLVEDSAMVRDLARMALETHGYTVVAASNGVEALRLADRHQGPVHLLMTDVVMTGMNGRQLAEQLSPRRPETKVLYMSGYSEGILTHHGIANPNVTLLSKPFTPTILLRKVREVLSGIPSGADKE